ncbi:MAG TPA: hypothetical protein VFR28_10220 [Allosphingosinicella sp.]|jgi:hypothetical protein|nr:hypothetical protein [Allosphingosinicella sp.]
MADRPAWTVRRILETGFLAAVGAGILWCGWGLWHDRQLPERFKRIHLGMDRPGVEAVLGRPDWQGACAGRIPYPPRAGCALELGYSSAFEPLRADHYVVQLDRSGRVIEAEPLPTR